MTKTRGTASLANDDTKKGGMDDRQGDNEGKAKKKAKTTKKEESNEESKATVVQPKANKKDDANALDTASDDNRANEACPFSPAEQKKIAKLLEKQFAAERREASWGMGQITCPLTGHSVCFCKCGPHLTCPEHALNCLVWWQGGYGNLSKDLDPLLVAWIKWQHDSALE